MIEFLRRRKPTPTPAPPPEPPAVSVPVDWAERAVHALNTAVWIEGMPWIAHGQHRRRGGCAVCDGDVERIVAVVLRSVLPAVQPLLNAQEAMLQNWAEYAPPGQCHSEAQQELWRRLHARADDLRAALAGEEP
ncbi:hypothetical protein ACQEU3_46985 [Spirillospora sp. CA-253888]